jgi:hypothetical protein
LAEWCKEHHLPNQRKVHLGRIIELDPDHEVARRLLGYVRRDGKWLTQEEHMAARGFVRHEGRWIMAAEKELIERNRKDRQVSREWFGKVQLWLSYLHDDDPTRQRQGLANLRSINESAAVVALDETLGVDPDDEIRLLLVEILRGIEGSQSATALVFYSLEDESDEVRWTAIAALAERKDSQAVSTYVQLLYSPDNEMVCRAAEALGEFRDPSVVPALIDALVTQHQVEAAAPARGGLGIGFSTGTIGPAPGAKGSAGGGDRPFGVPLPGATGMALGERRGPVYEDVRNPEALSSLKRLTGEDLGYDEEAWREYLAGRDRPGGIHDPAP